MIADTTFQHWEGAVASWLQRDSAVGDPHYSLRDLVEHDGILESHIEGLKLAGASGWELAVDGLRWEESGEMFVAAVLAFEAADHAKIEHVMAVAGDTSDLVRPIVSALGWLPWDLAQPYAVRYAASAEPVLRNIGASVFDFHRRDPRDQLTIWLSDDDLTVRTRATHAVGTLARQDLLDQVAQHANSENPNLAAQSSWCLALRRRDPRAIEQLLDHAMSDGEFAELAGRLLMSVMPVEDSCHLINNLAKGTARQLRLAIILTGLLGIPDSVSWLIEMMNQPAHARLAGEAFSRITGLRLDQRPFEGDWPEGFEAGPNDDPEDENVEMDQDENLPWPDAAAVSEWWKKHSCYFDSNVRYLLGWEISNVSWLRKILVLGRQRERATAALELALHDPKQPLFEIRANGNRQIRQLGLRRLPTEEYRCNDLEAGPDELQAERRAANMNFTG